MEPVLLTLEADEILEKFSKGDLSTRFQMVVRDGALRPFHGPGATVVLTRELRRGALACVASGGTLAWRRILALRPGGEALLRQDSAPMTDGWRGGIIGCLENLPTLAGKLQRVVERAPGAWTRVGWKVGYALAVARNASLRAAMKLRGRFERQAPPAFRLRPLAPADRAAYVDLVQRCLGTAAAAGVSDAFAGSGVGLFVGERLVGVGFLGNLARKPELRSLLVDPRYRGEGGCKLIVGAILEEAARRRIPHVRTFIYVKNFPSLAACMAAGFVPTGEWLQEPHDPSSASRLQQLELSVAIRPLDPRQP